MRDVIWRDGTHREEGGIEEDLERMAPVSDLAATRVWLRKPETLTGACRFASSPLRRALLLALSDHTPVKACGLAPREVIKVCHHWREVSTLGGTDHVRLEPRRISSGIWVRRGRT